MNIGVVLTHLITYVCVSFFKIPSFPNHFGKSLTLCPACFFSQNAMPVTWIFAIELPDHKQQYWNLRIHPLRSEFTKIQDILLMAKSCGIIIILGGAGFCPSTVSTLQGTLLSLQPCHSYWVGGKHPHPKSQVYISWHF